MWEFLLEALPFLQLGTGAAGIFDQQNIDRQTREQLLGNLGGERSSVLQQLNEIVRGGLASGVQEGRDIAGRFAGLESHVTSELTGGGQGLFAAGGRAAVETQRTSAMGALEKRLKEFNTALQLMPIQARREYGQEERGIISGERPFSPLLALSELFGIARPAPEVEQPKDKSWLGSIFGSSISAAGTLGAAQILDV